MAVSARCLDWTQVSDLCAIFDEPIVSFWGTCPFDGARKPFAAQQCLDKPSRTCQISKVVLSARYMHLHSSEIIFR